MWLSAGATSEGPSLEGAEREGEPTGGAERTGVQGCLRHGVWDGERHLSTGELLDSALGASAATKADMDGSSTADVSPARGFGSCGGACGALLGLKPLNGVCGGGVSPRTKAAPLGTELKARLGLAETRLTGAAEAPGASQAWLRGTVCRDGATRPGLACATSGVRLKSNVTTSQKLTSAG